MAIKHRHLLQNGMIRRGRTQHFTNIFLSPEEIAKLPDKTSLSHNVRAYTRNDDLIRTVAQDDQLKLAVFHLLLPYAMEYYQKGLKLDEYLKEAWNENCNDNDRFKAFIEKTYEQTGNKKDRISKDAIVDDFNSYIGKPNLKVKWNTVLNNVKRMNLDYQPKFRVKGFKIQGCICGLKRLRNDNEFDDAEQPQDQDQEQDPVQDQPNAKIRDFDKFVKDFLQKYIHQDIITEEELKQIKEHMIIDANKRKQLYKLYDEFLAKEKEANIAQGAIEPEYDSETGEETANEVLRLFKQAK